MPAQDEGGELLQMGHSFAVMKALTFKDRAGTGDQEDLREERCP